MDSWCKLCRKLFHKLWYNKNKDRIILKSFNKYYDNREQILKKTKEKRLKYPWKQTLKQIKSRCNNQNNPKYYRYGGRGIKCLITAEELKELWFRDKAYLMEWASIDRENNDGNYIFDNCRYIEMSINSSKDNYKKRGAGL